MPDLFLSSAALIVNNNEAVHSIQKEIVEIRIKIRVTDTFGNEGNFYLQRLMISSAHWALLKFFHIILFIPILLLLRFREKNFQAIIAHIGNIILMQTTVVKSANKWNKMKHLVETDRIDWIGKCCLHSVGILLSFSSKIVSFNIFPFKIFSCTGNRHSSSYSPVGMISL